MAIRFKQFLFFLLLGISGSLKSQDVSITITPIPPFSPMLKFYTELTPNRLQITIRNNTNQLLDLKFSARITSNNGIDIYSNPNYVPPIPFTLNPLETHLMTEDEMSKILDKSSVQVSGFDILQIINSGGLPEGTYRICMTAYDYNSSGQTSPKSDPAGSCSSPVVIQYIDPPMISSINGYGGCGNQIPNAFLTNTLTINWLPPGMLMQQGLMVAPKYKLFIHEVATNRRADDQIFSDPNPFLEKEITPNFATSTVLNVASEGFRPGVQYIFRLQITDENENVIFRNNGYSASCTFILLDNQHNAGGNSGNPENTSFSSRILYPVAEDTIPFQNYPIMASIGSANSNVERIKVLGTCNEPNVNWQYISDTVFYQSPRPFLATNEYRVMFKTFNRWAWYRGEQFESKATSFVRLRSQASEQVVVASSNMVFGMGRPGLIKKTQLDSTQKKFRIDYIPMRRPSKILPDSMAAISRISGFDESDKLMIREKLFIEIDKDNQFLQPKRVAWVDMNFDYFIQNPNMNQIIEDLFTAKSIDINIPNNEHYFARIGYLSDPTDTNSAPYIYSPEFHLNEPADGCLFTHYDGMRVGARVCIGLFTMKIKQLSTNTEPYNGVGAIKVPFLDHSILVDFKDLVVSSSGYVLFGTAQARQGDHTRSLVPQNLTAAAARTMLQNDSNRDKIFRSSRQNTDDTAGSTLPYLVTSWQHLSSFYIWKLVFHTNRVEMFAGISLQLTGTQSGALDFVSFDNALMPSCSNMGLMRFELVSQNKLVLPGLGHIQVKRDLNNRNPYIRFDCNSGISDGMIYADLVPDPRMMKLATPGPNGDTIITPIEFAVDRNRNMVFEASLPNFIVADLDDFVFQSCSLVVDQSTTINLSRMTNGPNARPVTWTGRQANDLRVALPIWFGGGGTRRVGFSPPNDNRIIVNISTLDLDGDAPSFEILKTNLKSISDGRKWGTFDFAIDTFKLSMNRGVLSGSYLSGRLKTPISNDTLKTKYKLSISQSGNQTRIAGSVNLGNGLKFDPLYGASMSISPTSSMRLELVNGNIDVSLNLNGSMSIEAGKTANNPPKIALGINFQDMSIKNSTNNAFAIGTIQFSQASAFGYGFNQMSDRDGSGFELVTRNIPSGSGGNSETEYLLKMTGSLGFPGFDFGKVGGTALVGFKQTTTGDFTSIPPELSGFNVDANIGPVKFSGSIISYENDSNWGTGFNGQVDCQFALCSGKIGIKTNLRLGNIPLGANKRNYWYASGELTLPVPIQIVPSIAQVNGLMIGLGSNILFENQQYKVNKSREENRLFRGGLELTSVTPGQFKAKGILSANMSAGWGINSLGFDADLALLGSGYHGSASSDYEFSARGNFTIDITNSRIHARATAYINAYGLIVGAAKKNSNEIGELDLLFASNDWHIHIGKPSQPLSVKVLGVNFASYFMLGNGMEPPVYSNKLLQALNGQLPMQPVNVGSMGMGIAHGANFDVSTGDKKFLMFYGSFAMGAGYNIALIHYDRGCNNSNNIGLNGWYATGDVYAYLDGKIGMYVDVFCYEGNLTLAELRCGAILMAGTPNPTWISGKVAGKYSVLGGLVKGKFNFEFTVGDVCTPPPPIMESPIANVQLIEDIGPAHNSTNMSLSTKPYWAHRFKNNYVMTVEVPEPGKSTTKIRTFRVKRSISFGKLNSNNVLVPTQYSINENSDDDFTQGSISLNQGYLDANTKYRLKVTAWFEEKINNLWVNAVKTNGNRVIEEKTIEFTTVKIAVVEPYMLRNQFPQNNRMFVYGTDISAGFWFQNRIGGLFSPRAKAMKNSVYNAVLEFPQDMNVKYLMKFTDLNSGEVAYTPLNTPAGTDNVTFNTRRLSTGKLFKVNILRVLQNNDFYSAFSTPNGSLRFFSSNTVNTQLQNSLTIPQNIAGNSYNESILSMNGDSNSIEISRYRKSNQSQQNNGNGIEQLIQGLTNSFEDEMYTTYFGTSKFTSFEDKCRAAFVNNQSHFNLVTSAGFFTAGLTTEPFDMYDVGLDQSNVPQNFRAFKIIPTSQNQFFMQTRDFYLKVNELIKLNKIPYAEISNLDFYNENTQLFDTLKSSMFIEEIVPFNDYSIANGTGDNVPSWLQEQSKNSFAFIINPNKKKFVSIIEQVNKIKNVVTRVLANEYSSEGPSSLMGIERLNTTNTGQVYRNGNISNIKYPYWPENLDRYRTQLSNISLISPTTQFQAGGENWMLWIHRSEKIQNQIFPTLNIRPNIHPPNIQNEPFYIYEAFTLPIR